MVSRFIVCCIPLAWVPEFVMRSSADPANDFYGCPSQAPQNFPASHRSPQNMYYRNSVIGQLQNQHSIVMLVSQNLSAYMEKARQYHKGRLDAWYLFFFYCNWFVFALLKVNDACICTDFHFPSFPREILSFFSVILAIDIVTIGSPSPSKLNSHHLASFWVQDLE